MDPKSELVMLLEERTLSHLERRRRRMQQIPWSVIMSAVEKGWNRDPNVTREEWIVLHFGWVPEEREHMIRFLESRGAKRCPHCRRGMLSDGPHARCPACGAGNAAEDGQKGETAR